MIKVMKTFLTVFLALGLSGCTKSEAPAEAESAADQRVSNQPTLMIPNYLVINAPSSDPDEQWYVSDFFRRVEQWEPETTNYWDLELGMYELTQYPNQPPTEAHLNAANKLVSDSIDVAIRNGWFDKEKGLADGYESMFGDPVHFVNVDYVFDGETLNPEKPEVLMYYDTPEGVFLMGTMFLAIGERGPQIAGPLSKWHYHIDRGMCYERGVLPIGRVQDDGSCVEGFHNIRSPEMLHVWFFDHTEGMFATKMGLSNALMITGVQQIRQILDERTQQE